tara:strand:+ start:4528 stop:5280 length:753 start_codon:yes stop_codon:yes gene_type:complete
MAVIKSNSNNHDSFANVAKRVYDSFSSIVINNIFYILLIAILPRLQAYMLYTDKIGNWTAAFLENNNSSSAQALQITLILLQYILIAVIYYRTAKTNSNFKEALIACLKKTHKIIIVIILYFMAVSLGIIALLLPGIYVMVLYSLSFISVITTDLSVIGAFKNSKHLVSGHWVFSFFAIIMIMCIPSLLFGFIGYKASSYTSSVILNEVGIIFASMISLIAMISGTLFLYDELTARQKYATNQEKSSPEA